MINCGMDSKFKPLLAGEAPDDLQTLAFPIIASPKLDGIRCLKIDGKALTRSFLPIPNDYIREWVEANVPDGVDGEIVFANDWAADFNELSGAVRRKTGQPAFQFAIFDYFGAGTDLPFEQRFSMLKDVLASVTGDGHHVKVVPHVVVKGHAELAEIHDRHIAQRFEGTMLRSPSGRYKFGRSTTKEGVLLKMKPFIDEDAVVIGYEEEMENTNEATTNALGRTERSTHASGMVGKGRVGKLLCRFLSDGTEFSVGSGLTDAKKAELWADRENLTGSNGQKLIIKVKHQPPPGGRLAGKKPRIPVFLGFREE